MCYTYFCPILPTFVWGSKFDIGHCNIWLLETIFGPKIAGPNVQANSSSWISAEGQACAPAQCCPYCSSPHSGLGRGKGRAAGRPLQQQDEQKRQGFQAGEGAAGQMRWDWKQRRLAPSFILSRCTSWNIFWCCFFGAVGSCYVSSNGEIGDSLLSFSKAVFVQIVQVKMGGLVWVPAFYKRIFMWWGWCRQKQL